MQDPHARKEPTLTHAPPSVGPPEEEQYGDCYFGGRSFHERSHGQSFIELALARFHPGGFYLLDEPEAALSFHGCLRMLRIVHDTVLGDGQFVIATHSPVLLAYPEATIFQLSEVGIDERRYDEVDSVALWRDFLDAPSRLLRHLLGGEVVPTGRDDDRNRNAAAEL